jgi:hypothetical protein
MNSIKNMFNNLLSKNSSLKGQHLTEYTLMIILVIISIVIMGPYVVRSWNAHLKGWDDGVKDSMEEPLTQAPVPNIPPLACSCGVWKPVDCGLSNKAASCTSLQMLWERECRPLSCAVFGRCDVNADCCTPWEELDCGVVAPHGTEPDGTCKDGQMNVQRLCGAPTPPNCVPPRIWEPASNACREYSCGNYDDNHDIYTPDAEDSECVFNCKGVFGNGPKFKGMCTDDTIRLPNNTVQYKAVLYNGCSPANDIWNKCENECEKTFVPNGPDCVCVPPAAQNAAGDRCICGPGLATQWTCPAGSCYRDTCAAGTCMK